MSCLVTSRICPGTSNSGISRPSIIDSFSFSVVGPEPIGSGPTTLKEKESMIEGLEMPELLVPGQILDVTRQDMLKMIHTCRLPARKSGHHHALRLRAAMDQREAVYG